MSLGGPGESPGGVVCSRARRPTHGHTGKGVLGPEALVPVGLGPQGAEPEQKGSRGPRPAAQVCEETKLITDLKQNSSGHKRVIF